MRKYYRAIARARMRALGVEQINKKNSYGKSKMMLSWKRVLWGNMSMEARDAQFHTGRYARRNLRRKAVV